MSIVVLDSTPVGYLSNPKNPPTALACKRWLTRLLGAGVRVALPEIVDYEVRRELVLRRKTNSILHLNDLATRVEYIKITTEIMKQASEFWAQVRRAGLPTAGSAALDGDVILAAQASSLGAGVVVATSNVTHFAGLVPAKLWDSITP